MASRPYYAILFILNCQFCKFTFSESFNMRPEFPSEYDSINTTVYATCRMRPNTHLAGEMAKVYGQVLFKQTGPEGKLRVTFRLHGLPTSDTQQRAIHIHQYGDLSEGCTSTGGHYNPLGISHPQHPGDFGNFASRNGKIRRAVDSKATLFGRESVLGRAVVIHEKEDDMGLGGDPGSLLHGNAGGRLACCVIAISTSKQWNKLTQ